jgi:hypothetical protein
MPGKQAREYTGHGMTFYKKLLSTFAIVKAPAFLDSGRPLPSGCAFLPPAAGTSS